MQKFNLLFITNNIDMAHHASQSGVDRLFIDLEINGKHERQGHLDTIISNHTLVDIPKIKKQCGKSKLLVRLNPYFEGSFEEINESIRLGADILMLPMFKTVEEIQAVSAIIGGRARFIPLVETKEAAAILSKVVHINGVDEIYFGLNDLHRDLKLSFMFEPLQNGLLDQLSTIVRQAGLPFGFGGIAALGTGKLPAELILSEHARLHSSSVILSRAFHQNSTSLEELKRKINFTLEINKLRETLTTLYKRNHAEITADKQRLDAEIKKIIKDIKNEAAI